MFILLYTYNFIIFYILKSCNVPLSDPFFGLSLRAVWAHLTVQKEPYLVLCNNCRKLNLYRCHNHPLWRHKGWLWQPFQNWALSHRQSEREREQLTGQECYCKKTEQNMVFAERIAPPSAFRRYTSADWALLRPFTSSVVVLERTSKCQAVSCSCCSLVLRDHTSLLSSGTPPALHSAPHSAYVVFTRHLLNHFLKLTSGPWPRGHTRTGGDWAFRTGVHARRCHR